MSSGEEFMDIVNEADEVVGRDTRATVHAIRFVTPSDIPAAMRDAPFTEGFRRSFALWSAATLRP
jgi:hypothetical protein